MPPTLARLLAALGLALLYALWAGIAVAGISLGRAFFTIASSDDQTTAAVKISEAAAHALLFVRVGEAFALSGIGVLAAAIWVGQVRERWIFWGGVAGLAAWIAIVPFGTLLGLGGITAFVVYRRHFFGEDRPASGSISSPPA